MIIKKLNESYIKLEDIGSEEQEFIDKRFSVLEDNYIFNAAYKNGFWDGKKHFFDVRYNTLPYGFLETLETALKNRFKDIEIEKKFEDVYEQYKFEDFYKNLNLADGIDIRDYQQLGFESAINQRKCILRAATGAGKSLILWLITKYLTENLKKDVLIIVPQTQLVEQLADDFSIYGEFRNGLEVGKSTAKKLGKREAKKLGLDYNQLSDEKALQIDLSKNIVISTWQTLQNKPKEFFDRFDAILMDEVHHIDGITLQSIMNHCVKAIWRIGMTGTLKQSEKSQLTYIGYFCRQIKLITPRELIDRGFATEVDIYPVILHYPNKLKYEELQDEVDYIAFNEERLEFIVSLIKGLYNKSENNNTLILFKSVEKGFWRDLERKLSFVENLYIVHGKSSLKDREIARKEVDQKNNCVILASFPTFSTGVNIKNLHNIVFTESYKSMVKIAQSIGRGMRKHSSKDKVKIFDITDKFKHKNMTYKQFEERLKIYEELEFVVKKTLPYTIKNI